MKNTRNSEKEIESLNAILLANLKWFVPIASFPTLGPLGGFC